MMLKTKLIVDYSYDFSLGAIASSARDYNLAWHLNKVLDVHFTKQDDFELQLKSGGSSLFSLFTYETITGKLTLLKNKSVDFSNIDNPFLLSELKNYDYLLKIDGEVHEMSADIIIDKAKTIQKIQFITSVVTDNLKLKENLIF